MNAPFIDYTIRISISQILIGFIRTWCKILIVILSLIIENESEITERILCYRRF